MNQTTGLIPRATVIQLVANYKDLMAELESMSYHYQKAQDTLKKFSIAPYALTSIVVHRAEFVEHLRNRYLQEYWRYVIDGLGLKKYMSLKRLEELSKNLDERASYDTRPINLPPFEEVAILEFLQTVMGEVTTFFDETVKECFDMMRVGCGEWRVYKTNKKNARFVVKDHIIMEGWIDRPWKAVSSSKNTLRFNYRMCDRATLLERVFHMLDGTHVPENYRGEMADMINSGTPEGQTEYFRYKACLNGNLHLWFLRADLVKKFNEMGGRGQMILDEG